MHWGLSIKDMREILADHAGRYPFWTEEDLYKLVHQAALGSEHALKEKAGVAERLLRELEALGPGPEEPLLDPLAPGGAIIRVHLRPFARRGLDPGLLADAFIRTAQEFRGSPQRIEDYREIAAELALAGRLQVSQEALQRFFGEMKAAAYPAVHHSAAFAAHYRPAYRVVAGWILPDEITGA
jgi:hypothetical protein